MFASNLQLSKFAENPLTFEFQNVDTCSDAIYDQLQDKPGTAEPEGLESFSPPPPPPPPPISPHETLLTE